MIPKSEVKTKEWFKKHGYYYIRSGRSFGLWDFIASNRCEILYIQSKCNQGPRSAELERLKAFKNYPKGACIKLQIWIWKKGRSDPIIKNITKAR